MSTPKKKPAEQERKPQPAFQRRYPAELKDRAVRMVQELRREDPGDNGVISRVARQLGVGTESRRTWMKQADIDSGARVGTTTDERHALAELQREVRELRRANEILRAAGTASWQLRAPPETAEDPFSGLPA